MGDSGWDFGGRVRVQDEENSEIAAESVADVAPTQRRVVWSLVRMTGPMATWEMEKALGGLHQSVSATVNHLHRMGALVNTGEKNSTPSGRPAWIYRAVTRAESDAAQGIVRVDPLPPGSPPVSPLRSPGRYEAPQGDPTCPVHGSTCRKVWHRADPAPGRPGSPQEGVPDHLVRLEREGKADVYVNPRKAEASSRDAARAATAEEERQRKIATPRVDPASHRLTFGGPLPCTKCDGTGGNLWEGCIYCGGKGLR